jgi:glycosyltransferase involved in cell wall biosynthesis
MSWLKNNQKSKLKVILVTNIIAPYRIPVYNYLANQVDLNVFFLGEKEKNRKWEILKDEIKFKYQILRGWHFFFQNRDWGLHINYDLVFKLIKTESDILVITGYESPGYWLALFYAKLSRRKFIFWNGTTLLSIRSSNFFVNLMRRIFIKNADAYLTYGTLAKEFLVHYGAKADKVVVGCNTVDVAKFRQDSQSILPKKEEIKKQKGLPRLNIIFSGQLIERKGLMVLLRAFQELNRDDIGLIVLGDGPEKEKYQNYCRENKIKNVFFEGHQPMNKIIEYYTIADVLVCPSSLEVWGLIINEAMACGLPIICSDKVGAGRDLVKHGINGYIFKANNVEDLKSYLDKILSNDELRGKMGHESLKIISNCRPEDYANNLLKAIYLALNFKI